MCNYTYTRTQIPPKKLVMKKKKNWARIHYARNFFEFSNKGNEMEKKKRKREQRRAKKIK